MLYAHETSLSDIWDVVRDPEVVSAEREAAKKSHPFSAMLSNSMAIGQSMLQALETGEYVGRENREIEHDRSNEAKADAKQRSSLESMRSAESARRLASMEDDVRSMERRAAEADGYDY